MNQINPEKNVLPIDEIKKCTKLFDLIKNRVENGELECDGGAILLSPAQREYLDGVAGELSTKYIIKQKFSNEMLELFNMIGDLNELSIIKYHDGQIHLTSKQQRDLLRKYRFKSNQEIKPIKTLHSNMQGFNAVYTLKTSIKE